MLLYWSRMCELGILFFSCQAMPTWDSGESNGNELGVRTISAPRAFNTSSWKCTHKHTSPRAHTHTHSQIWMADVGTEESGAWYLLHAHHVGHGDDTPVASDCGHQGEANPCRDGESGQPVLLQLPLWPADGGLHTCVTRGGFNDGVSRLEQLGSLRIFHHPQGNSVLGAAPRAEELALYHWAQSRFLFFIQASLVRKWSA